MADWIVSKFGGSSVRDTSAMRRCAAIVKDSPRIKIVIISATYQTTNHLEEVAKLALKEGSAGLLERIRSIEERHLKLASDLLSPTELRETIRELCLKLRTYCEEIESRGVLTDAMMDSIYSIGERLSSSIFADYLKRELEGVRAVVFKDARTALRTEDNFGRATPIPAKIKELTWKNWRSELETEALIVTQGFIGSAESGATTTLGREGSDYSATLFGEAIGAKLVQIWTDVCGIATGDPRYVDGPVYLPFLSYEEATLMAENGAKVLFERTLAPAERGGCEVFVGSSLEPNTLGTLIRTRTGIKAGPKGVAFEPTTAILTVVGLEVEQDEDLLRKLTELGGVWKRGTHLYQREKATLADFKEVHALIASSLK